MFARHYFYNNLADTKPSIAISACLMGDAVRYDGQHKAFPVIARYFQQHAQLEKVCPEMQAGLGVPRPAVALTETSSGIRALGVDNPGLDVTAPLTEFSRQFVEQHRQALQAVIVKSRSPSCGLGSTPINDSAQQNRFGSGIFTQTLLQQCPQCLIIEESRLNTEAQCQALLFRCYVLLDINNTAPEELPLLQVHYSRLGLMDLSLAAISAFNIPS